MRPVWEFSERHIASISVGSKVFAISETAWTLGGHERLPEGANKKAPRVATFFLAYGVIMSTPPPDTIALCTIMSPLPSTISPVA